MARRLRFDIPGRDWRVSVEDVRARGVGALFAPLLEPPLRLVVEVGFGRGEFLMQLAAEDPGAAHLGIEYSGKRVLKTARRLARTKLGNVRLLQAPAELAVQELLPPSSVEACWVNFPDPWPKKRHHKRRLFQAALVRELALRLRPGGAVHVATDHAEYAEQIDSVLRTEPRLENAYAPAPWLPDEPGRMPTAYEVQWRREGRTLFFWAYRRRAPLAGVDTPEARP